MVYCKVEEIFINKDNMLEIVDQTLAIEIKHCCCEKVPTISMVVQGLPIYNFEEGDLLFLSRDTGEGDDFFVYDNLDYSDKGNQVHVPQGQNCKVPCQQDKSPQCPLFDVDDLFLSLL